MRRNAFLFILYTHTVCNIQFALRQFGEEVEMYSTVAPKGVAVRTLKWIWAVPGTNLYAAKAFLFIL
jgi:hypothetical protein